MLGYEQNFRPPIFMLALNHAASFETIHSWHGNVENHYIGVQIGHFFQRLEPVRSLAHHFPIAPSLQESSQPLPHNRVIVYQQDADRHAISNPSSERRAHSRGSVAFGISLIVAPQSLVAPGNE